MANIPTSGPWHVERTTDGRSGFTVLSIVTTDGLALANLVFQLTDTERANARLMAAAPDLLEQLRSAYDFTCYAAASRRENTAEFLEELFRQVERLQPAISAAIAKAEGR